MKNDENNLTVYIFPNCFS